jgi:hypothetical protein
MESNRKLFPILWSITSFEIPTYSIQENKDISVKLYPLQNIFDDTFNSKKGIEYDINRVSSRNARKSELGPYKNSFLRDIISSHSMGKASGTKNDLVSTILSFHETKSK